MRWVWPLLCTILLLITSGLAGCIEDQGDPEEGTDPETDETEPKVDSLPWSLTDCRVVVALVPADAAAVEAHLPEGFTAASGQDAFGLPPTPGADAVVGVETFACASGSGRNGTIDDLAYGAYFTAVSPPENHTVDGAELPLFKWDTLVPDQPRREFLQAHGLPVVDGSSDLSGFDVTQAGHVFDVTVTLGGHEHRFQGASNQPADDFRRGFYFVEHMVAEKGLAAWHMPENEAPDALSGTGTVTLASGSLPAEIVGGTTSQAFFASATTVQFVNGTIELP